MNALFREHKTKKTYWAITEQQPPLESGTLIHWLAKDEKKNRTTAYPRQTEGALRSELSYQVIGQRGKQWLLMVNPVTGRPHQIRVQLAAMGCPIRGDVKYGAGNSFDDGSIALHARKLEFVHPVKKVAMELDAPPPATEGWKSFLNFEQ
jgi:23S rRNA pseudouridine1911/1915/1917 synthase